MSGTDPDDRPPTAAPTEPRVRDLLAAGAVATAAAPTDHAMLARLTAWFGEPDTPAGPAPEEPASAMEQRAERRRAALAHVDPSMVERLEQHTRAAARMSKLAPPHRTWAHDSPFDHPPIRIPEDDEWREWDIPRALAKDLKDCTPQAKLRDLHRPVKDFVVHLEPTWKDVDWVPPDVDPMAEVRAAIRLDFRAATRLIPAPQAVRQHAAEVRASRAFPWAEAKRERARKRERELLAKLGMAPAEDAAPSSDPTVVDAGKAASPSSVSRAPEGSS